MKRVEFRPPAPGNGHNERDSDSQVSRATLGLREMLLRGEFWPGQRIAEIPLSEKLGVSRTPLRLAFERLEHEGLVQALPRSGFTASEFSLSDIWDAIETRGVLEGAAARLAAERLRHPSQLDPLRKLNRTMEEIAEINVDSFTRYLDLNYAFHLAMIDLANNQMLRRAIEQVYKFPFASPSSRVLFHKSLPGSNMIRPIAEEHHRAIVISIERRQGARAESLAREHSLLTRRNLEEALADRNHVESMPGVRLIKAWNGERAQ
jgi:GntR family transcriptional regulator of vanillate catabolism